MALAQRVYALLLAAYPARLREVFGDEMLQLFLDQLGAAHARGQLTRFYIRTICDWLRTVPAEHLADYRRRHAEDVPVPVHRLLRRGLVIAPSPAAALWIAAGVLAWRLLRTPHRETRI